jgi:hypothetical protein
MAKDTYVRADEYDLKTARHNTTVFMRELRARPWWGVILLSCFSLAGVLLIGWGKLSGWDVVDSTYAFWTGILSFMVALYLAWAIFGRPLFMGDRADAEEVAEMEALAPAERGEVAEAQEGQVFLMLDIDGVLHPGQSGSLRNLPMLQEWLRSRESVQVVISSDWRYTHSHEEVVGFFDEDLRPRVHGFTPVIEGAAREAEIEAYTTQHGITNWVALDDVAAGFASTGASRLVMTDAREGVTERDLAKVDALLGLVEHQAS